MGSVLVRYLRSLLFSAGWFSSIVLFAFPTLLTFPLPFEKRYAFVRLWTRFNLWWLRVTCNIRYEVEGRENIPSTNAIVFCKHQSTWETLALQCIFPPQVWVLKKELLRLPFFGWGLAMLEPIAIDRKRGRQALKQLCEQGLERLKRGRWVVVFPEGTRVAPGKRGHYHIGGAMLARYAAYPVVPVAHNAGMLWPRGGFLKTPGIIRVKIGRPIDSRDLSAKEINQLAEQRIEQMMETIAGVPAIMAKASTQS